MLLSLSIIDSTDNPPIIDPSEKFCKIGAGESCATYNEVVAKITMQLLSVQKRTDSTCGEADSPGKQPYAKVHFYIKEQGSSTWDLKQSLSLIVSCKTFSHGFSYHCICYGGEKSGIWYYHLKQGDEIKITAQVYEARTFWGPLANLRSRVSIASLSDIRVGPPKQFVCSDAKILYYYNPNTTGLMSVYDTFSPTLGKYLFPIEQSTVFAVDGFPMSIID
jgi:hypothetical protein